ncbi:MAG: hypothetical protein ACP5TV_06690 [Anaerolineae bacterium]
MTTFKPRTNLVLTVAKKPRAEGARTEGFHVPVVNLRPGLMERMELSTGELLRLSDANRWRIIVCRRGASGLLRKLMSGTMCWSRARCSSSPSRARSSFRR